MNYLVFSLTFLKNNLIKKLFLFLFMAYFRNEQKYFGLNIKIEVELLYNIYVRKLSGRFSHKGVWWKISFKMLNLEESEYH